MSALIRWTIPIVAYLCVGTVITATLGYFYLRHSGKLDDATMFRVMALLHGVDLDKIAAQGKVAVEETPPEEPSFVEQHSQSQAAKLIFDAKQKQLDDSLSKFDTDLKLVNEATERYKSLQRVVEDYFREQQLRLANSDLASVRAQLEALDPKKQAKPILINYIKDDIDTAILLLGSMKDRARQAILKTFDSVEDVALLYQLQQHMLNDNPAKAKIQEQLDELNKLKSQEK